MKIFKILLAASVVIFSSLATAQMTETNVTASNGIVVSKNSDDFAERYEYSAPVIDFKSAQGARGAAFVAKTRRGKSLGELNIQGFIMYSGEWRFFESALFKGGDPVNYKRTDGKVGSCRYGCTLTESFYITLNPTDIQKHSENGVVAIQIRSRNVDTAILAIPVSYFDAVDEVAK